MAKSKKEKINYVIGAPWKGSAELDVYAYSTEVQFGTLKEAKSFLKYVVSQLKLDKSISIFDDEDEPSPEDYKIYKLVLVED